MRSSPKKTPCPPSLNPTAARSGSCRRPFGNRSSTLHSQTLATRQDRAWRSGEPPDRPVFNHQLEPIAPGPPSHHQSTEGRAAQPTHRADLGALKRKGEVVHLASREDASHPRRPHLDHVSELSGSKSFRSPPFPTPSLPPRRPLPPTPATRKRSPSRLALRLHDPVPRFVCLGSL